MTCVCGGGDSCVSYQLPQYCCKRKNLKNLRDPQQWILFSSYLCRDSAALGWVWLILADLAHESTVCWSWLSLLRYLGKSWMTAGLEWPHLTISGTQICFTYLSSFIRLVGACVHGDGRGLKRKRNLNVQVHFNPVHCFCQHPIGQSRSYGKRYGYKEEWRTVTFFGHLALWLKLPFYQDD